MSVRLTLPRSRIKSRRWSTNVESIIDVVSDDGTVREDVPVPDLAGAVRCARRAVAPPRSLPKRRDGPTDAPKA